MFSAIMRLFRSIGALFTGNVNNASKNIIKDPRAAEAVYDKNIEGKRKQISALKEAVARLMANNETKITKIKKLNADLEKLEKLKAGSVQATKKIIAKYGSDKSKFQSDPDYVKYKASFVDYSRTIEEKTDHVNDLEDEIKSGRDIIAKQKANLQSLMRETDKLKDEKNATIADLISAKEQKEIADMFSGISVDNNSKDIEDLREARNTAKQNAKISNELAGLDINLQEQELLDMANSVEIDSEFDALLGIAEETEQPKETQQTEELADKLPE